MIWLLALGLCFGVWAFLFTYASDVSPAEAWLCAAFLLLAILLDQGWWPYGAVLLFGPCVVALPLGAYFPWEPDPAHSRFSGKSVPMWRRRR